MTHWSGFKPPLLGWVWAHKGGVKASLLCCDNAEVWKGLLARFLEALAGAEVEEAAEVGQATAHLLGLEHIQAECVGLICHGRVVANKWGRSFSLTVEDQRKRRTFLLLLTLPTYHCHTLWESIKHTFHGIQAKGWVAEKSSRSDRGPFSGGDKDQVAGRIMLLPYPQLCLCLYIQFVPPRSLSGVSGLHFLWREGHGKKETTKTVSIPWGESHTHWLNCPLGFTLFGSRQASHEDMCLFGQLPVCYVFNEQKAPHRKTD